MVKVKNCGNCKYFQKVPGYGICQRYDWWTQSDHGRSCSSWKGIKYERTKKLDYEKEYDVAV